MTPDAKAWQLIDDTLAQAGWIVQDMTPLNPSAGPGIAVRESPTDTGPADDALFVNRTAVGSIEEQNRPLRALP